MGATNSKNCSACLKRSNNQPNSAVVNDMYSDSSRSSDIELQAWSNTTTTTNSKPPATSSSTIPTTSVVVPKQQQSPYYKMKRLLPKKIWTCLGKEDDVSMTKIEKSKKNNVTFQRIFFEKNIIIHTHTYASIYM